MKAERVKFFKYTSEGFGRECSKVRSPTFEHCFETGHKRCLDNPFGRQKFNFYYMTGKLFVFCCICLFVWLPRKHIIFFMWIIICLWTYRSGQVRFKTVSTKTFFYNYIVNLFVVQLLMLTPVGVELFDCLVKMSLKLFWKILFIFMVCEKNTFINN